MNLKKDRDAEILKSEAEGLRKQLYGPDGASFQQERERLEKVVQEKSDKLLALEVFDSKFFPSACCMFLLFGKSFSQC